MKKSNLIKRGAAAVFAGTIALSLAACGNSTKNSKSGDLTYWVRIPGNISTSVANYGETNFAQEYMKRIGIKVSYMHPAQGQESEALNLLLASGNLPDIIETDWLSRNPDSMIAQKVIQPLNSIIEKNAPNFKKYLEENPDIAIAAKTDSGQYYAFPFVRNGEKLLNVSGFYMRDDWMKELDLEYPETLDEWEEVLTAFKEKKGAKGPLVTGSTSLLNLASGYGIDDGFYVEDGKVKYGVTDPAFGKFLETMNRWYKNGLIDKNLPTMEAKYGNSCMLDGSAGVSFGAGGSGMGVLLTSAKANGNENYSLRAVKAPAETKGAMPKFSNRETKLSSKGAAAITANCKNVDLAAKFLDYSYSDEGEMLNNFGIEGESYTMVDGEPKYTENITNSPKGLSMAQALGMYVRSCAEGPFVQDERYIEQYYPTDQQREALDIWSINETEKRQMPLVTLTADEQTEYSNIMTDFETFKSENIIAFIIGTRPINEFDKFVQECKSRNLDRAVEIYQTAYERYMNRK